MEIDNNLVRDALKRIMQVEREHVFGVKTGSDTARRRELEKELERAISQLIESSKKTSDTGGTK